MTNDLEKLQGTWKITSLEIDGQKLPSVIFDGASVVIQGGKFKSLGMGTVYEGDLEVDAAKQPKQFDMVFTEGPEKGNRNLGIYSLEADTWTFCLATQGKIRPDQFATKPGTGFALQTLHRAGA